MDLGENSEWRLGIDIGGTFTDFVMVNIKTGKICLGKSLTCQDDPALGVLTGLDNFFHRIRFKKEPIPPCVHGTTLISNSIIERKGAKTALITTQGFRDILEIGRELRYDLYNLFAERPAPLIPRSLRLEVKERTDVKGRIIKKLDVEKFKEVLSKLVNEYGIESLAIVFLHSYADPKSEELAEKIVHLQYPNLAVCRSSDIVGEIREYERASTTVANAYVKPIVDGYLNRLASKWHRSEGGTPFFMMSSNGGFVSVNRARQYPIKLAASGAAAGVIAAKFFGETANLDNIIAFDMGGTTAKASVVKGKRLRIIYETEVARAERFKRGSGLPIRVPVVDLIEVGAGGGSMAFLDIGRLLKVGPQSAEANPGPACYGKGGKEPTVTDADLLLGYLNPNYFLGGEMPLLPELSYKAIASRLADPLHISIEEAAWGIREVVNENMSQALRVHVAERGEDPRNFALVATGGAGPTHAFDIAIKLAIETVVYPFGAGVASCVGLLVAPSIVEIGRSYPVRLSKIEWDRFFNIYRIMEKEATSGLIEVGVLVTDIEITRQADMRYVGQGYEVTVDLPFISEDSPDSSKLKDAFEKTFILYYGRTIEGVPIELINLRIIAKSPAPSLSLSHSIEIAPENPLKGERKVYLDPQHGWIKIPVFDRYALPPNWTANGPVLIEERESTAWIGIGGVVRVDEAKNLIVSVPTSLKRE